MKVIAWLDFEPAYFDFVVMYINHNTTVILILSIFDQDNKKRKMHLKEKQV